MLPLQPGVALDADDGEVVEGAKGVGLVFTFLQELGLAQVAPRLEVIGIRAVLDEADLAISDVDVVPADAGGGLRAVTCAADLRHRQGPRAPACHGWAASSQACEK